LDLREAARLTGWVLNPFFLFPVLYGLVAAIYGPSLPEGLLYGALLILAVSVVVLSIKVRTASGKAGDFWLMARRERLVPALVLLAAAVGLCGALVAAGAPRELVLLTGSMLAAALLAALVTLAWKISAHATVAGHAAVWGPALLGPAGLVFALALPAVVWSRAAEKRHTIAQALAGACLGVAMAALGVRLA
jgi:hypothetical protein